MVISHKIDEKKIGNCRSKSELNLVSVKEQRVDSNWCIGIKMYLRYTLMGGKSRYPIKYPSKQLNNRFFSTLINLPISKLNSWFITRFADVKGCFSILIIPDARLKLK